jgi:L-rhamnose mutarotase
MKRIAFKMKLNPGKEVEYKKRHDEIWPELVQLLKSAGISNYSIFLDPETSTLYGLYNLDEQNSVDELPHNPLMKNWWSYMSDIMESNQDKSPVSLMLEEVFYMQ